MKALLVDNQTDTLSELKQLLKHFNFTYDITDPDHIHDEAYSLVILSGGVWHASNQQNESAYTKEIEFIKTTKKPVIGICLGMLLISLAHDMELKDVERRTGNVQIRWNDGRVNTVYENHSLAIGKLSPDFRELATSDVCTEVMQHRTRPLLGIQFHPEVDGTSQDGITIFDSLLRDLLAQ